ncbi:MAG: glycosyltransferase, partial [Candidatus Omnitrophica bacterium]|nr:glycosyltransferase [Candidatus Omnitrophota bacterium]
MIKNESIICISSIDWDFVWQGHQEIMSTLANNGNRVLFVENTGVRTPTLRDIPRLWKRFLNWKKGYKGIRKISENLFVYSPLVLPFPYSKIATKVNRFIMLSVIKKWMKALEFRNPIVWSFLPTALVVDMLNELNPSIFIYYCIDDFASSSKGARKIKKVEEKVIRSADLVFTTSRKLFKKCQAINKRTYSFPFGVSIENYNIAREKMLDAPGEMHAIKRPIVGYIGGIHKWIDFGLLRKMALQSKDISFVLIGPKQVDLSPIIDIPNIYILGKKNKQDLPAYVKFFDAGIIPYRKTAYTENVYPTKINEYLAMGKPVISTKIPEVVEFDRAHSGGIVYLIEGENDFSLLLSNIISQNNEETVRKRIALANSNSWSVKLENMCDLIQKRLEQIHKRVSQDWIGSIKGFYVKSRRRTIKIAGVLLALYLVVFYSPFMWLV